MTDNDSFPTGSAQDPEDPTAQQLRHGLSLAGRDVRAPSGIATAALHGGRRRRRHRRTVLAAPIVLIAVGAAGWGWQQPWVASKRTVPAAPSQLVDPTAPSSPSASSAPVEGQIEVPNVVGTSMSEATDRLTAAGFGVRVPSAQVASPSIAAGLVATQSSYAAAVGAVITITASSGSPSPSSAPALPGQQGFDISVVAYDIPDMTRARSALSGGQTLANLDGVANQSRSQTPLAGPVGCSTNPADPLKRAADSVAGREFMWLDETLTQNVVTLQVTGWPTGTGTAIFDDATSGSLTCRMTGELTPVDFTIPGADQSWAVTADLGGPPFYITGSARVGDLIVSASLPTAATDAATDRSKELVAMLTAAVEDLRASGLPAVEGE